MAIVTTTSELGTALEAHAARYLQSRGLALLGRQLRFRRGEIDLLMRDGETLVFVEVRYRRHAQWGDGAESVNRQKRARLRHAAMALLARRPELGGGPCRFDVMAGLGPAEAPRWSWYRDAFRV